MYSPSIKKLISAFAKLPSVGQRTAERYVFYLLKSGKKDAAELAVSLKNLIEQVKSCQTCWDFSDQTTCVICADDKRNKQLICVVAEPQDVQALERTGVYTGVYHVLRGTISPEDEQSIERTKVRELFSRVTTSTPTEIILALSPDMAGETTIMLLEKKIKQLAPTVTVTRLARGLPIGSDLQYADEITLESAIKNRR